MITCGKFTIEPADLNDLLSETSLSYDHPIIFVRLSRGKLDFINIWDNSIYCYHTITDTCLSDTKLYDNESVVAAIDTKRTRKAMRIGDHKKSHVYLQLRSGEPCASQIVVQRNARWSISVRIKESSARKSLVNERDNRVEISAIPNDKIEFLLNNYSIKPQYNPQSKNPESTLRAKMHISGLERIIRIVDHIDKNKKLSKRVYPIEFHDKQLSLNFDDKKTGNSTTGYLSPKKIEGPDHHYEYGRNLRTIVKRLSGLVDLIIEPDGRLMLVKRKRGKIFRYLITPTDQKS